jgi:hypothetical protein
MKYHSYLEEDNMDEKKVFVRPIAKIIDFDNNDIITYSSRGTAPDDGGETPGAEDWGGNN